MTPPSDGTTPDRPEPDPTAAGSTRPLPRGDATRPPAYEYPSVGAPAAGSAAPGGPAGADSPASPHGAPTADAPTADASRRRTGIVVAAVAGVAIIGGGAAVAFTALDGGGPQPADVLPGDAIAYARVDIDPSAGQKVAAVRFFQKLPEAERVLAADDPRKGLWESAAEDDECLAGIDYATQVEPWLGERLGAAVRAPAPGGDEPRLVVAVQVTDEAAAATALPTILACADDEPTEIRMHGGYALITGEGEGDETLAAVGAGTLAQDAEFTGDMAALGEEGVASVWYDAAALGTLVQDAADALGDLGAPGVPGVPGLTTSDGSTGRVATAVRFDSDYLEVAAVTRGMSREVTPEGDGSAVAALPDDTMAALHLSDGARLGASAWTSFTGAMEASGAMGPDESLDETLGYLGLTMPDDLEALLGTSFTLVMPEQELGEDLPTVGLVVRSAGAARAEEVLTTVEEIAGGADLFTTRVSGDRLVAATTPGYVDGLDGAGTLGETEPFATAVGDVEESVFVAYAHLDALEANYLDEADAESRAFLEAMRAVGVNVVVSGDDEARMTLRLVAN